MTNPYCGKCNYWTAETTEPKTKYINKIQTQIIWTQNKTELIDIQNPGMPQLKEYTFI